MSSNCNILLTRYASFVGEVVAFVSHSPKNPKGSVIWYGELLYTCNEIISEFESFMYFMDEIVILKKSLWIGLNSRSDIKKCGLFWFLSYWWTCVIKKLYTFPDSGFRFFRS